MSNPEQNISTSHRQDDICKMQELATKLNEYSHAYYVLDNPIVADKVYDDLYYQLQQLEQSTGIVLPNSPTTRVGDIADTKFAPHVHLTRLLSLDKVNSYTELQDWDTKICNKLGVQPEYCCEYKIDGLTLNFTYNKGNLVKVATRGDGIVGETVTAQVQGISSIPKVIEYNGTIEIQGEGYIRLSDLAEYNATSAVAIKNARNGVAGAIRNLQPQAAIDRKVDVLFYHINHIQDNIIDTHSKALQFLRDNKFDTIQSHKFGDMDSVVEYIKSIQREELDLLIDGMVIKVDDYGQRAQLGHTDKFPRWAVAYKFESLEVSTILNDVVWQVGRTGKLTPMAILQPVDIGGVQISRATLNNIEDINRKGLGIGSTVFVRRSNDVIPEILYGVVGTAQSTINQPNVCPMCNQDLSQDGVNIFCINQQCPAIVCSKIEHWVARGCMDIQGISVKTIQLLYDRSLVKTVVDLYRLQYSDLDGMMGFGAKKITNILTNIQASKTPPLHKFVNALGINGVGKKTAKDLTEYFGTLDNIVKATQSQLLDIQDIGDSVSQSIVDYFGNHHNIEQLQQLHELGVIPQVETKPLQLGILSGKKVVITGTLSKPRNYFVQLVVTHGGSVNDSISKNTDIVLAGENAGSKLAKATQLGIRIVSETELHNLLQTIQN
ncbi:MAG: NAD-dependent DNA ligase LigA [Clostridiales bacterium]|jgi:DNA ligase (NAD+)|nr:NAD-dependent DNA ligase LigA [Clostridiales bacterium]